MSQTHAERLYAQKRRKQTCNGCRAYERVPGNKYSSAEWQCSLHYPQDNGKPLAWCPKPTTVQELIVLLGK